MSLIVQTTDFVGRYEIAQNTYNTSKLQSFIDTYEEQYLVELLGAELFNLFNSDVVNYAPQNVPYTTIFNQIRIDFNSYIYESSGIKKMLLGFIYFEFCRANSVKNTISGFAQNNTENSSTPDFSSSQIYEVYNISIKNYRIIQQYIFNNTTTFPLFNGQMKTYAHPLI